MGEIDYDRPALERLLAMAKQLAFQDEVNHWTAELAKLNAREEVAG